MPPPPDHDSPCPVAALHAGTAGGPQLAAFTYDTNGRPASRTHGTAATATTVACDWAGRLLATNGPLAGTGDRVTQRFRLDGLLAGGRWSPGLGSPRATPSGDIGGVLGPSVDQVTSTHVRGGDGATVRAPPDYPAVNTCSICSSNKAQRDRPGSDVNPRHLDRDVERHDDVDTLLHGEDVEPLVTRPLTVGWDAPPDAVAASIQRAIDDRRYDDAGHPEWPLWLVGGSVDGRALNLRLDMHSQPGRRHAYPAGLDLRGELLPRGSGTVLVARAAMLNGRWERPLALLVGAGLGIPMLLLGGVTGAVACVAVIAAFVGFYWGVLRLMSRGVFAALPQVEAVLGRVGAP